MSSNTTKLRQKKSLCLCSKPWKCLRRVEVKLCEFLIPGLSGYFIPDKDPGTPQAGDWVWPDASTENPFSHQETNPSYAVLAEYYLTKPSWLVWAQSSAKSEMKNPSRKQLL